MSWFFGADDAKDEPQLSQCGTIVQRIRHGTSVELRLEGLTLLNQLSASDASSHAVRPSLPPPRGGLSQCAPLVCRAVDAARRPAVPPQEAGEATDVLMAVVRNDIESADTCREVLDILSNITSVDVEVGPPHAGVGVGGMSEWADRLTFASARSTGRPQGSPWGCAMPRASWR